METLLPSEVARLTLGYLQEVQCMEAYDMFLRTSPDLTECLKMKEQGKNFRTQVLGMSLIQILHEYSGIHSLVHERLNKIDPDYSEKMQNSSSLLSRLTFLLNNASGKTMLLSITLPSNKSPTTAGTIPERKHERSKERKRSRNYDQAVNEQSLAVTPVVSNVNTTPLCSLPGNTGSTPSKMDEQKLVDDTKTPRRKVAVTQRRGRPASVISSSNEEGGENLDLSVLTQALLDNHELQEKIAENINKIICTPDIPQNTPVSMVHSTNEVKQNSPLPEVSAANPTNNFTVELDNAIKKVVVETESDPIFEHFLQEVLGPVEEASDESEDKMNAQSDLNDGMRNRLRSSKPKISDIAETAFAQLEDQNAAAIQNIQDLIAINTEDIAKPTEAEIVKPEATPAVVGVEVEPTPNLPVMLQAPENIIELHIDEAPQSQVTETCSDLPISIVSEALPIAGQVSAENSNVMIPTTCAASNMLILSHRYVHQPQFLIMSESFLPIYRQPLLQEKVLSIGNNTDVSQVLIQQHSVFPSNLSTTGSEDAPNMSTISTNSESSSVPPPLKRETQYKKILPKVNSPEKKKKKKVVISEPEEAPVVRKSNRNCKSNEIIDKVEKTLPSITINLKKRESESVSKSVPLIPSNDSSPETTTDLNTEKKSSETLKTRLVDNLSKGTSHIRALDFSSPMKNVLPLEVPESIKSEEKEKKIKTKHGGLSSMPIATRSPRVKLKGEWDNILGSGLIFGNESPKKKVSANWDSELRGNLALPKPPQPSKPPKTRVPKTPKPQVITKPKRKYTKRKTDLNKTDDVAMKIEAELAEIHGENACENEPTDNIENDHKADKKKKDTKIKKKSNIKIKMAEAENEDCDNEDFEQEMDSEKASEGLRNMNPRRKKKCNMVPVLEPNPVKDSPDTNKTVTVLSPSTLNVAANKRTIIEPEIKLEAVTIGENIVDVVLETSLNRITPNTSKPRYENPMSAIRNLSAFMDTPVKFDNSVLPITPRLCTPMSTRDSPFSKIFAEKFNSVDYTSISTPNFPVTPTFNQLGDSSSYKSRPTDYSNSSSYYMPSDTEVNQKLEQQLISECIKMEKNKKTALKSDMKVAADKKVDSPIKLAPPESTIRLPVIASKVLVKPPDDSLNDSSFSTSSSSESSSDSSSSCSSGSSDDEPTNATVIDVNKDVQGHEVPTNTTINNLQVPNADTPSRYSLRSKDKSDSSISIDKDVSVNITSNQPLESAPESLPKSPNNKQSPIKPFKKKLPVKPIKKSAERKTPVQRARKSPLKAVVNSNSQMFAELEAKRQRVIATFKQSTAQTKTKTARALPILGKRTRKPNKRYSSPFLDRFGPNKSSSPPEKVTSKKLPKKSKAKQKPVISDDSSFEELKTSTEKDTLESEQKIDTPDLLTPQGVLEGLNLIPTVNRKLETGENVPKSNQKIDDKSIVTKPKEKPPKIEIKADEILVDTKKIDTTKIAGKKTNKIQGTMDKIKVKSQQAEASEVIKPKDVPVQSASINQKAEPELEDEVFDMKLIDEDSPEYFNFVYDPEKPSTKKKSDYSLQVLKRKISAQIFIEELGEAREKTMTVTPFVTLLNLIKKRQFLPKVETRKVPPKKIIICKHEGTTVLKTVDDFRSELQSDSSSDFESVLSAKLEKSDGMKSELSTSKPMPDVAPVDTVKPEMSKDSFDVSEDSCSSRSNLKIDCKDDGVKEVEDDSFLSGDRSSAEDISVTDVHSSSSRKRKASDSLKPNSEKKNKLEDKKKLLHNWDIDKFLAKVHGPSDS